MPTKIEWTEETWNPIRARAIETGKVGWFCVHATAGCLNCYAEGINRRLGTGIDYKAQNAGQVEVFVDDKTLRKPLSWRRPRAVFPCSMTDLFADFVTDEMLDKVFGIMGLASQHTFQVLTKRPDRARAYLSSFKHCKRASGFITRNGEEPTSYGGPVTDAIFGQWPLPNVWLGTSVEDQANDWRVLELLATPAAIRWVSAEPLLGPLNIGWAMQHPVALAAEFLKRGQFSPGLETLKPIDWVVVGGESGPKARPMEESWVIGIRNACTAHGVAYFFKQMVRKAPIPDRLMLRQYPKVRA